MARALAAFLYVCYMFIVGFAFFLITGAVPPSCCAALTCLTPALFSLDSLPASSSFAPSTLPSRSTNPNQLTALLEGPFAARQSPPLSSVNESLLLRFPCLSLPILFLLFCRPLRGSKLHLLDTLHELDGGLALLQPSGVGDEHVLEVDNVGEVACEGDRVAQALDEMRPPAGDVEQVARLEDGLDEGRVSVARERRLVRVPQVQVLLLVLELAVDKLEVLRGDEEEAFAALHLSHPCARVPDVSVQGREGAARSDEDPGEGRLKLRGQSLELVWKALGRVGKVQQQVRMVLLEVPCSHVRLVAMV
eukprot:650931-Hanusia_phi.AAC.3